MIPRYDPTYTLGDLTESLRRSSHGGPAAELESRLRALYGVKHAVLLDSARAAIATVLRAHGRPGDVLMPAYTCIVVPEAVRNAGYRPRFADIDGRTLQPTIRDLERALTRDTTVVMATHLFGMPCDIDAILAFGGAHGLLVVEDAAPALGVECRDHALRAFGAATVISFDATKVISGEKGGALLTDSDELAGRVRSLLGAARGPRSRWRCFFGALARKAGSRRRLYPLVLEGYRRLGKEVMYEVVPSGQDDPDDFLRLPSDFSIDLVLAQLDRLPENLRRRRRIAAIYAGALEGHPALAFPPLLEGTAPAWIQFPVMAADKEAFYRYMQARGVDMSWTYRYACPVSYGIDGYPGALKAARTVLGLPTYPSLTDDEARRIAGIAKAYVPA
jgi:dTDP-4-amino-4,6-dideoxygalactose transaminase